MSWMRLLCRGPGLTLPWRGRVGARSAPGWGDRMRASAYAAMLEHPRFAITRAVERSIDHVQNAYGVLRDLVIPEADDSISFRFQPACALVIARSVQVITMLRTINLNDEPRCQAGKIRDVRT